MNSTIPWAMPCLRGRELEYVSQALDSTWVSGGPFVDRFEKDFSQYCDVPHALAVSNGTTAIHLAYLGLGLGPGDEIIVPGFGFQAAANVALHVGATPVFAEVDANSWCITAQEIRKKLTARTRAVVPVHTYGNVCDMDPIMDLARETGFAVVEDAAESFGSSYRGHQSGTLGTIGCYSFQATKTITTGEGGMVVTRDDQLATRMRLYRSHGTAAGRYWHEVPGHNFRLTNLQAAMGCAQLEHLDVILKERRRVHDSYKLHLKHCEGVALQAFTPDVDVALWNMAVKLDPAVYPQGRDAVLHQLELSGIECRPGFYSASQQPLYNCASLPICESISRQVLSLPTYPQLTEEQIGFISSAIALHGAGQRG